MDAAAMVRLARVWTTVAPQQFCEIRAPDTNKYHLSFTLTDKFTEMGSLILLFRLSVSLSLPFPFHRPSQIDTSQEPN